MDFAAIGFEQYMEEEDREGSPENLMRDEPPNNQADPIDLTPSQVHTDTVSSIHKCLSKYARKLCIYDICFKLKTTETYDIGGTYSEESPDLWFYFTSTVCPGHLYLLNLFVCHRKVGNFSIGISASDELTHDKKKEIDSGQSSTPNTLSWNTYRSAQKGESYHIKTFCFSKSDISSLEQRTLHIPIEIEMDEIRSLNNDFIKRIKLNHDFGDLLVKKEKSDFILESVSKRQFHTHKIILAAHSPVLRNMIKNTKSASEFIDISDNDMELLLQFIYTGTISNLLKQDCLKLLEIADKFELENLFLLMQYAIKEQISVDNVVGIALLTEKYKLGHLQNEVFKFIKRKPEVFDSDGWKNLSDVNLAKKFVLMFSKE